ncbi:MAG: dihydropteroate synthase [Gammaproteobacteria bacterium]|jgi:dihydropteroate synthase|nr:dihydropteroate synthase [Gammaproteobacteria bacterium]NCF83337.1 dihydropteroate synthase [Pseudomonadota bacterium]
MGILNVTPDSFSDGGRFEHLDAALQGARKMLAEGADVIDVGGESTRPGAQSVAVAGELDRVIPVIEAINSELSVSISIDTSKPEVMEAAVDAGASMINDVMALRAEGAMETARDLQVPVCLMHMQGLPRTMQKDPRYKDVVSEVREFLLQRIDACVSAGMDEGKIIIDPGFGFGKTLGHNLTLLANLGVLVRTGFPVLAGLSRKSMIASMLDRAVDSRVAASAALALIAVQKGAAMVRVHDVAETADALNVAARVAAAVEDASE